MVEHEESVLVTGGAGFIGSHVVESLLRLGHKVTCLDNFDDFYSPSIKRDNIAPFRNERQFALIEGDVRNPALVTHLLSNSEFGVVIHLAARAGVRTSINQPAVYLDINTGGTLSLLEACSHARLKKFIFASSSSVYGALAEVPFRESHTLGCPTSPYAASKACAEMMCRTYNHLYGLPITVVRLFTVYGPRQRPEMAVHHFTRKIDSGEEITVFGDGTSRRDYTFVSDIVDGILRAMAHPERGFDIFNLGSANPIALSELVRLIEEAIGKTARVVRLPMQPGDMGLTIADTSKALGVLGYQPKTRIEEGVRAFVDWYRRSKTAYSCPIS